MRWSGLDSVPAYARKETNANRRATKPVHQSRWSKNIPGASTRIHAKMPAAIRPTITKIPVRAAEESFTGDGMGAATGSPAERLPALAAELQVPGVLRLAARARHGLGGAALPAELQARRHRLAAFDG